MNKDVTVLAGTIPENKRPLPPFAPVVLNFLQEFSRQLLRHPSAQQDPAWAGLGFWLRSSHLRRLAASLSFSSQRLGRGLIFHIAPANMPAVFAYSLCISLLAGNGNIVRISPRLLPQAAPICELISTIWDEPSFYLLKTQNAIISYDKDDEKTASYSAMCDGRVIWGGDAAVSDIRRIPLPPQAVELVFADRYSLAVFSSSAVASFSDDELRHTAHLFYNDTYTADQNACSSPRIIFWVDDDDSAELAARERWWQAVAAEAGAYDLQPIKVSAKYTDAWTFAASCPGLQSMDCYTNALYVYTLSALPDDITALSGSFGQFFQYSVPSADRIIPYFTKKIQTVSTIGISPESLRTAVINAGVLGADRIIPVGQALDMDVIWDGYHMIESLSRIVR